MEIDYIRKNMFKRELREKNTRILQEMLNGIVEKVKKKNITINGVEGGQPLFEAILEVLEEREGSAKRGSINEEFGSPDDPVAGKKAFTDEDEFDDYDDDPEEDTFDEGEDGDVPKEEVYKIVNMYLKNLLIDMKSPGIADSMLMSTLKNKDINYKNGLSISLEYLAERLKYISQKLEN